MQQLEHRMRKKAPSDVNALLPRHTRTQDERRIHPPHKQRKSSSRILLVWFKFKNYWSRRMSERSKGIIYMILMIIVLNFLLGVYDGLFHQIGNDDLPINKSPQEAYFAVAINTFKRPDRLRRAVEHYADTCGKQYKVNQVFVIWAEQGVTVPEPSSFFTSRDQSWLRSMNHDILDNRAQVVVLQKEKDSLNSRFEPIEQLQSTAVFMVDDDIRVDCKSLGMGFDAWNRQPNAMVGYYPRLASPPRNPSSSLSSVIYHTWPIVYWSQRFNFVLTKASFLHSKYLALYSGPQFPQEVRDHVDEHKNCEDIAMSMLVANYTKYKTGKPSYPIYVEGTVDDRGLFGGISTGSGHMMTRSECLTRLSQIFEKKKWPAPLGDNVPLSDYSWVKHAPGFWWQATPSNFFEWISPQNTLT